MSFAFILLTSIGAVLARPDIQYDLENAEQHFQEFILEYGREYSSIEERAKRFEIFKQALKKYNEQNLENPLAQFGINEYSDLSLKEFRKFRTSYLKYGVDDNCTVIRQPPDANSPDSWDWREHNAVGEVKYQGLCAPCWAF